MPHRTNKILRALGITVLALAAMVFALCFRFSIVERIEIVDEGVYSILEQAADSAKMKIPARCHAALFVSTTENSIVLGVDAPDVFRVTEETKGYLRINGVNIFWTDDILGKDIPEIYSRTGKKSVFLILSLYGKNLYGNSDLYDPIMNCWDSLNLYHKYIDGRWCTSTFKQTEGEHDAREYARWRQEHPDTLDKKPVIPPVFIEKYDSISNRNFDAFLRDWKLWSGQMLSMSADTMLNAVIAKVMADYRIGDDADSCKFISFFDNVEVRRYSGKFNDYPMALNTWGRTRDENWEYMMKASERYHYVPSIDSCRNILYITPEIHRLLSLYVGGVYESEEDCSDDYGKLMPVREDRLAFLRQLIPVVEGHWGGWHLCTMPIVYSIYLFDDGFVADMRFSCCTGDTVFYPFDPSRPKESAGEWIE